MNFNHISKRKLFCFVVRELPSREMQTISEHLAVCSQCQKALSECMYFEERVKKCFAVPCGAEHLSAKDRIAINTEVNDDMMKEDAENQKEWENRTRKAFGKQVVAILLLGVILLVLFVAAARMAMNRNDGAPEAAALSNEPEAVVQQLPVMPSDPGNEHVTGKVAITEKMMETPYVPAKWKTAVNANLIRALKLDQAAAVPLQKDPVIQAVRSPFDPDMIMVFAYTTATDSVKDFQLAQTITNSVQWPIQTACQKTVYFELPGRLLERLVVIRMEKGVDTVLTKDQVIEYGEACPEAKLQILLYTVAVPNMFFNKEIKIQVTEELEKIESDPAVKGKKGIRPVINALKGIH